MVDHTPTPGHVTAFLTVALIEPTRSRTAGRIETWVSNTHEGDYTFSISERQVIYIIFFAEIKIFFEKISLLTDVHTTE